MRDRSGYLGYTFLWSHPLQGALESGQEASILQINFSAEFDSVNQQEVLNKLGSIGIGGYVDIRWLCGFGLH